MSARPARFLMALFCFAGLMLGCCAGAAAAANYASPGAEGQERSADPAEIAGEQLKELGARDLEEYFLRLDSEARGLLPNPRLSDFLPGARGTGALNPQAWLSAIAKYLFREVWVNARLLAQLLVLAVMLALLQAMQGSFGDKSFGDVVFAVCFMVLVLIGINTFRTAVGVGREAINNMVAFMQALIPMLTSLLVAAGSLTSAALMSPVVYTFLAWIAGLTNAFVIPLLFFAVVLGLTGNISEKLSLGKLAGSVRQICVGILGVTFTVFIGVMTLRGITAPISDALSIRAGKFLASNFIPVIGKMFSDAVEIVAGSTAIAKNAVGLLGILIVAALCVFPVLKILALVVVYRLTGALIQSVSDKRLVDALNQLESSLLLLMVVVGAVGVMFFMSLTILIGVGNLSLAVR